MLVSAKQHNFDAQRLFYFVYVIRTGHKRLAVIVKLHSDF